MKKIKLSALPYSVYAVIFIVAPIILIIFYSLNYRPDGSFAFTLEHFKRFFDFSEPVYMNVLWRSIRIALISTVICLTLGYPMAYILSRMKPSVRGMASFLFILPMWMNFLLRTYSWMTLLENTGVINSLLLRFGLSPLNIMYTEGAVIFGNVYNFLPFMILPIYNSLTKMDNSLIEAAGDLGANFIDTFKKVIFPLSLPGVASGISMTFMPAVTTFIISKLLGGGQNALIGDLIEKQFKSVGDWGFGSAMSVVLMVMILVAMAVMGNSEKESAGSILG
ncbi:MAG: ABC transporter permease [Oscillospiraceae bacterium]|jgi:spermidine/putrescine transport system permease protein|nr:ABC transporter permease [Oscillospiraceae bacterium]